MRRVAFIGDAFMDINLSGLARLPQWGIDVPCAGVRLTVGGSCANTARQLASLARDDLATHFFSCVGEDDMGKLFRRALSEEDLLVNPDSSLHVLPGVAQSCCTILAGPSDRAMISCYSSNDGVTIAPFCDALLSAPPALLHLGGYYNCTGLHTDALLDTVSALKARGTLISLDPQHDANEKWTGEGGHLTRLFPTVDIFLPNEVEICKVASALLTDTEAADAQRTPEEAMEALAVAYPRLLIVLTLGASGVKAARGPTERWTEPAQPVTFVDATGAGDACAAGFLCSILRDANDVQRALKVGAAAGALCVGVAGACETPMTPAQLEEAMA